MRGLFITFEGTEGAGKTTQIERLSRRIREMGHHVRMVREPGGTPLGEEIRALLKHHPAGQGMSAEAELLLMSASRAELVRKVIRPALDAGEIVICDRFFDSTVVYQGYGRGLDLEPIERITTLAVGATVPDLTLVLQVPLEVSEVRRAERLGKGSEPADRFDGAGRDFFLRVEQGFEELLRRHPDRMHAVDAVDTVDAVERKIWCKVESLFQTQTRSN